MTSYQTIYRSFMSKILDDEWEDWTQEETEEDLLTLLEGAIPHFKFPRKSLDHNEEGFIEDLDNEEIQILAAYMRYEWLNRTILTWENVKPLYEERDFSQANLIDKFNQLLKTQEDKAKKLEAIYYRSIKGKPYDYKQFAGSNYV